VVAHAIRALDAALGALDDSHRFVGGVVLCPPHTSAQMAAAVRVGALTGSWDVLSGGATRQDSVRRGLGSLPDDVDIVLVHDAARPFVPAAVVARVVAAVVAGADAVVPVLPVSDTVKQVDTAGAVVATPDRSVLRLTQTPQGFRRSLLERAYSAEGLVATDDAGLVEQIGGLVQAVDGDQLAFKITGPLDLLLADAVLNASDAELKH
jgi:2-C-methyl-D-erythritol 4-phosphate cytidylyltransferase